MATAAEGRAFLDRPWDRLRREKDRYIAKTISERGTAYALDVSDELRWHAALLGAARDEEDRDEDLANAVRLRRLLDRANRPKRRAR
jgi:hypothetical protein